jgi:O-succinylbenzoate synthase
MELVLQAYYNLVDGLGDNKEWVRKVEDDLGQSIAYMAIGFDESVRDSLVQKSELFQRFDLEKQKFFK